MKRTVAGVWAITAGLLAAAAVLFVDAIATMPAYLHSGWRVAGLALLVALFAGTEIFAVHFHFARNAHTFSLVEIPLVLGLFFLPARALVVAHVVGSGTALLLHRRQPLIKWSFNVATFAFGDQIAILVFRQLAGGSGQFALRSIGASGAAAITTSSLSALLVFAVIWLTEGRGHSAPFAASIGFGALNGLLSTSLGLIAVAVISAYPQAAWLLVLPTSGMYLANRAFASERKRNRDLELLYASTRLLHGSPQLEAAMGTLLVEARETLRAAFAELVYLPAGASELLDLVLRADTVQSATEAVRLETADPIWAHLQRSAKALWIDKSTREPHLRRFLHTRGVRDALVAPMVDNGTIVGLVVVGDRQSDVDGFDEEDARLLETLANQITVAVENGRLELSLDALRAQERRLSHQATHDPLTELANRVLFGELVAHALEQSRTGGRERATDVYRPAAVVFIDLDDFKLVNDNLGHAAGDELLVVVARRLRHHLPPGATPARLGGDEFAIVVPEVERREDVDRLAELLVATLSEPVATSERTIEVSASIGIALSSPGQSAAELLADADAAMYAAKAQGKRRAAIFGDDVRAEWARRGTLHLDLARAATGEFVVEYQPIIDLSTSEPVGVEALVRWEHPTLGRLQPADFLPTAETSGATLLVARAVLEQVCDVLTALDATPGGRRLFGAVNLSSRDLEHGRLLELVRSALDDDALAAGRLVLEFTEAAVASESKVVERTLRRLDDLGIKLTLDDLGTGALPFGRLCRLPLDYLKVPAGWPARSERIDHRSTIARAALELAPALNATVIAKGIERTQQRDRVAMLGCRLAQGFLLAKPMPAAELIAWLPAHQPQSQ